MPVPVAPGRLPLLGHTLPMLPGRWKFTASLRNHGDIVRVDLGTMRTYFLTNPRLVHELLITKGPLFRKGALFDKFLPFFGNGLATSNGAFHRRQRRMVQPAFHRDRIGRYAETMARAAADLTATWHPGQVRVVEEDTQALAVTIVGEALFSTEMGRLAIEEVRRSIFLVLKHGMVRALSPSFVEKLPLPATRGRRRSAVHAVAGAGRHRHGHVRPAGPRRGHDAARRRHRDDRARTGLDVPRTRPVPGRRGPRPRGGGRGAGRAHTPLSTTSGSWSTSTRSSAKCCGCTRSGS